MGELKYEKYIVKRPKPNEVAEFVEDLPPEDVRKRVLYLDDEVVKGAFYMATSWFFKASKHSVEAHTHDFDEVIGFSGSNPDDVYDLGGEVEFWIEDEKYLITNSFMAFVPAGVSHCPLRVLRVDRPIFHYSVGPGKMYKGETK
jgi:quercetin dioxygenase-like cupin family protein